MSRLRDEGMRLLRNRVKRMVGFLNADPPIPDVLVVNEAALIAKAAMMLDLKAWQNLEEQDLLRRWKEGMGVCQEEGCDEYVARSSQLETQSLAEHFDGEYCSQHSAAAVTEIIMNEAEYGGKKS
jgi:hypothetical protein